MGDLRAASPEPNGGVLFEEKSVTGIDISKEYWKKAEVVTQEIIAKVQPTVVSEERRKAVIDYVQRLIGASVGCEVFPFGSVPLKTYLPDGDIDLTAFGGSGMNVDEALAYDVCSVLEREDQIGNTEFIVKDVQLIRAEVKLVKCLVQNIVVDISFNQLGGLCTLCFLEQVDRLIGKDHLFKRSIILIKAWCYYESRILGAHHGLISTYALETLVLYIFHLFNSSLDGPLAVLYKFLEYFSKFDWDNYCISLNGPVRISSLPDVVVETPENGGSDLLLSNDFLKDCMARFSVPARGSETNPRVFLLKNLNIVDPLKENNNLGRSVSKGNFYRIKSAFTYGARKLGGILSQPEESIANELSKFFSNTLNRHGSGQRPDVQDSISINGRYGLAFMSPLAGTDSFQDDWTNFETEYFDPSNTTGEWRHDHKHPCHGVERKMNFSRVVNEPRHSANGPSVSENRLSGDAKDLATSRMQGLSISSQALKSSAPGVKESISPKSHHAPHLHLSNSVMENGEVRNGSPDRKQQDSSGLTDKRMCSGVPLAPENNTVQEVSDCFDEKQLVGNHEVLSSVRGQPFLLSSVAQSLEDQYPNHSNNEVSDSTFGSSETLDSLSDLSGDFENHQNCLQHGRYWYESATAASASSMPSQLHTQFPGKNSWDVIRQSMHFRRNAMSQMNANGGVPRPMFYPINPPVLPGGAYGVEEMPKPRGTGTYIPNTNHYRDRSLSGRGRNQGPVRSPRANGRIGIFQETSLPERFSHEHDVFLAQYPIQQGGGKVGVSDVRSNGSPEAKHSSSVNGSVNFPDRATEIVSHGHPPPGASLTEGRQLGLGSNIGYSSSLSQPKRGKEGQRTALSIEQNKIAMQSYHLKDEDDFPPLSDQSGKVSPISTLKKHDRSEQ